MGLFDELLRTAVGAEAREPERQSRGLVEGLLDLLQSSGGGVDGLARSFEQKGLGAEAASWIGTDANRSISPAQIIEALGAPQVDGLARRAGLGSSAGAAAIAAILPALIDKLTPDGRAPEPSRIRELGGSILGGPAAAAPRKADFSNVQSGSSSTAPPPAPQEQWYTVAPGDSLSKIAKRYYGDAQQWRQIYDANRDEVKNPDLIHPGQKLRIPHAAQKRS